MEDLSVALGLGNDGLQVVFLDLAGLFEDSNETLPPLDEEMVREGVLDELFQNLLALLFDDELGVDREQTVSDFAPLVFLDLVGMVLLLNDIKTVL